MGLLLSKLVPREGKKLILNYEAPAVKTVAIVALFGALLWRCGNMLRRKKKQIKKAE